MWLAAATRVWNHFSGLTPQYNFSMLSVKPGDSLSYLEDSLSNCGFHSHNLLIQEQTLHNLTTMLLVQEHPPVVYIIVWNIIDLRERTQNPQYMLRETLLKTIFMFAWQEMKVDYLFLFTMMISISLGKEKVVIN